ncbi:MAG: radical SAM family heme chaperone HemW [Limnospira sp.]
MEKRTDNGRQLTIPPPPTAAYLHIPFCRRRCYYCDFAVSVVGDRRQGENSGMIKEYVGVLCREITTEPQGGVPLQTVFFGGGTPSLLSVGQFDRILRTLDRHFRIAPDAEISVEMDPGTFDLEKLQGFVAAGANRVSVGVQAFQDELLQHCGRSHTVADTFEAIEMIHQVGVANFSIDLISGLPHQTPELWQASLEAALALNPPHLSHYDLIVEPKTPFGRYYQPGEPPLPDEETTADFYRQAQDLLTSRGYRHYEVSNYARPGFECRHNLVYWKNRPYYGFGMGAASYVGGHRLTRPRTRDRYYRWVEAGDKLAGAEAIARSPDILLETLMLGLRLAEGLDLDRLERQFGRDVLAQIHDTLEPYRDRGWVAVTGRRLRLTDPEGFLFSNTILADLFDRLEAVALPS